MFGGLLRLKLSTKILAVCGVALVAFVAAVTILFINAYRHDAIDALSERAAAFTAVADESKSLASASIESGAVNFDQLLAEALEAMKGGKSYRDTTFFDSIPVVVGWRSAERAANKEGIQFRISAFDARNPENEPSPGTFRHSLLRDLEAQIASGGKPELSRVNEETNTLHYMRAVGLEESCMVCHGDPKKYDADGDGKDPLGFTMESWKVGDTHGAYEVMAPLETVDDQVASFIGNAMMVIGPAVVVVFGFFVYALRRMITTPLSVMSKSMEKICTGDLTHRVDMHRADEIGEVATWFDKLVENMHAMIREIADGAGEVAAAATQIAASNEEMSAGMNDQKRQTEAASSAVAELDQSVAGIARESAEALATAEKSRERATSGRDVVGDASSEITEIAREVNESAQIVKQLGEKSEEIGGVIGVINEIAEQTNLLALNAAIEAARAGEHGRGFAVVADEVRKLAERTTTATDEVSRSIREIQEQTSLAADRIQQGAGRMDRGVELANHAGDSLSEIVMGSASLLDQVQSIAAAAEEQAVCATQIADSVRAVSSVTIESVQAADQAAQAANALSRQSEHLRALVQRFKV
ncbi:MAG: hypothetical protein CMJ31_06005 [Phycisphaerae bacterium]|nr:hypothetical protein [Phycisphaerae bacterium]